MWSGARCLPTARACFSCSLCSTVKRTATRLCEGIVRREHDGQGGEKEERRRWGKGLIHCHLCHYPQVYHTLLSLCLACSGLCQAAYDVADDADDDSDGADAEAAADAETATTGSDMTMCFGTTTASESAASELAESEMAASDMVRER